MKLIPYKRARVTQDYYIWVTNHYIYSDFGVRESSEMRHKGRRYISPYTPGTGFFEHDSDSHSYHQFIRKYVLMEQPSYWRMLTGKEPDYDKELQHARKALSVNTDDNKRDILESYINSLSVGSSAQKLERVVRSVRKLMHHHHHNKTYVSIASHYKSRLRTISHDMSAVEYRLDDRYPTEVMEAYYNVVEAFIPVSKCRRIWHLDESDKHHFKQVFFDLGVFDFIRCNEGFLPLMRDSKGVNYYILPDSIIVARGSLDFDVVPIKDMTIVSQELAIEEAIEVVSSQLGDAASMIRIPDLNLTFYFNHYHVIQSFVEALNKLQKTI